MPNISKKTAAIILAVILAGGGYVSGTVTDIGGAFQIVMNPSGDAAVNACKNILKAEETVEVEAPPAP